MSGVHIDAIQKLTFYMSSETLHYTLPCEILMATCEQLLYFTRRLDEPFQAELKGKYRERLRYLNLWTLGEGRI